MSDVIDNSKMPSIEKYDNRIRVSNYDLTRFGNENLMILNLMIARSQNAILKRLCLMIVGYTIAASTGATLQPAPSIFVLLTKTCL